MTDRDSQDRTSAVRGMLVQQVASTRLVAIPSRRRLIIGGALAFILSGAIAGGAVSAIASGRADDPVLPEYIVGTPLSTIGTGTYDFFGDTVVHEGSGDATIELGERPTAATGLLVEFQCTSAGQFTWHPVGREGNVRQRCLEEMVSAGPPKGAGVTVFPVDSTMTEFVVTANTSVADAEATWVLSLSWVRERPVEWSTNDRKQTYGVEDWDGSQPDLLNASGSNAKGRQVEGYVLSADLDAANARLDDDPDVVVDLPLYASDGETVVGAVRVGG